MLSIDIHTHIIPEHLPKWSEKFGYGGFVHLEHHKCNCARMMVGDKFFREIEHNCWNGEERIKDYDNFGVQVQVISTIPVLFCYWAKPEHGYEVARFLNDHIAETVAANPTRFVGLGTVPLQSPELAVRELERCMLELGLSGVEIGSHVNDWNLNDEALFPFYEAAERLGAAIFVHPWDMMASDKMSKYWLPWLVGMPAESSLAICSMIFGGVLEKFPKLRVAFAHGGGSFPGTLGRIQHGFDCRPDLVAVDNPHPPTSYLGKFWVDSLVHDKDTLKYIINIFGSNRIALGSDYPFPLGETHPGKLIHSCNFDSQTTSNLLYKSALEWLNIPESFFNGKKV